MTPFYRVARQLRKEEPLKWSSRAEVGRLQWHMLRCALPHETKVRREWHSAVRRTLESFTDNARVINAAMACWSTSDRGAIHTAVEDEPSGWQAPTTRLVGNDGKWEFADGIFPPLTAVSTGRRTPTTRMWQT